MLRKVYIFSALIVVITVLFISFDSYTKKVISSHERILRIIKTIEGIETKVDGEIFKAGLILYYNYDQLNDYMEELDKYIEMLEKDDYLKKGEYSDIVNLIKVYKKLWNKKKKYIEDFKTANSPIKNTAIYLPLLTLRYMQSVKNISDLRYTYMLAKIVSSIYLSRNAMDLDFVLSIKKDIETLKNFKFKDPEKESFNRTFVANVYTFFNFFDSYTDIIRNILEIRTRKTLSEIESAFSQRFSNEARTISLFTAFFTTTFVSGVGYIIYLLFRLDKENKNLQALRKTLEYSIRHDNLTGLPNRYSFEEDVKNVKNPFFVLINIDDFRSINDLYGTKAGDYVLRELADLLRDIVPEELGGKVYRLGADDFGILFDAKLEISYEEIVNQIIEKVENHRFIYENNEISISVTAGISTKQPLIETADIALKHSQRTRRSKVVVYSYEIDNKKQIERNLKLIRALKDAISNDRVVPYYQPIMNNTTEKIEKYEALMRVIGDDGNAFDVEDILPIAKESKLYGQLTKIILHKTFMYFRDKDYDFSINISLEDIVNKSTREYIYAVLDEFKDVSYRLTFEILESEEVKDYEEFSSFIRKIKEYGVKIAIDDFGSGYSNFSYLINKDIDYFKIDGSLIKNIHKDTNARLVVETIVSFAKKANIKTIAEFVNSREVFEAVKEIGIDYSQGYYVGVPISSL